MRLTGSANAFADASPTLTLTAVATPSYKVTAFEDRLAFSGTTYDIKIIGVLQ